MTIKTILDRVKQGSVINKGPFDRYHGGDQQGQQYDYNHPYRGYGFHRPPMYHPPPHVHYSFGQPSGGGHKSNRAAMSALTLLSFLFFLNILQQCLKEQMTAMNPTIAVMAVAKEDTEVKTERDTEERRLTLIKQPGGAPLGNGVGRAYPAELHDGDESTSIITEVMSEDFQ